ncbi:Acetyltransferase (GNAT) domain-containing protein [Streptoalloteichus tenebrarius]|uniref:Acetyltransferase (GNAT) domain-containing protein n=1 Tax=Streptoalloteichus tenebrarius (strain ATCC 17920 / DSM 40477 / JCM 4838 / CBS 697.72 / NBRC 16177 / NCIMB 11028 / NRRL B-12390 / A12253. 1 / ISP 5477) TaxID=1933 RepID=A0ABT1HQI1_STRSD|nr:GNAT family N-acetyltransferase [Streptoalloteichus tenebrarius]MCP2257758.1 Acetyltransferase (GNAT) domain-containing protein [Streptoalloteichus tenebrarius]BFE99883.1 GNAT family N-acetyltransferase [Streptoalloteichus tenebrarius]
MAARTPAHDVTASHGTPAHTSWRREIVELAALFVTAGVAHLFATGVGLHAWGPISLVGLGVAMVVATVVHRTWLARRGRRRGTAEGAVLWRLRAAVDDTPGRLAVLADSLAQLHVNIRTMQVHPTYTGTVDEFLVHAPATVTADDLAHAVGRAGARDALVTPADVHDLNDTPTRTLTLATRLARAPHELPDVLAALLGADEAHRRSPEEVGLLDPATQPGGVVGSTMYLTVPEHGVLVLSRAGVPFTPAEFARARAMADLAVALAPVPRPATDPLRVEEKMITVRPARRDDLAGVRELHSRCSAETLYRRYRQGGPPPDRELRRLLTPELGHALVGVDDAGEVVALANLMWDGDRGEIALLVRDDLHGRGLGGDLARRLVAEARAAGLREVYACTSAENTAMIRTMRSLGLPVESRDDGGQLVLTARWAGVAPRRW